MTEGDENAKKTLIERNLRLVVYIARKFENTSVGIEDLISIGTLGLIKAINTFCIGKNIKLATYASRCIENEILMTFRAQKKYSGDINLDEPIETDKDGNQLTLMDIISDDDSILDKIDLNIKSEQLYEFLGKCLNERELTIIAHRYGLFGHKAITQREVAEKLDISRSYVSRIEKKALSSLKKEFDRSTISGNKKRRT